jgi:hypothetical protein
MNVRAAVAVAGVVGVSLGLAAPLRAHRVDEYLQAARISVGVDRVSVELDLTPGTAVAPAVLAMIDTDGNGDIAATESEAYARRVIDGLVMAIDGQPVRPRLDRRQMPAWRDVSEGTGTIRLTASATLPLLTEGTHELAFGNTHRSDIGVYLANAMLPGDRRIEITAQRRDAVQHQLAIDYKLARQADSPAAGALQGAAGLVIVAVVGVMALRKMTARRRT